MNTPSGLVVVTLLMCALVAAGCDLSPVKSQVSTVDLNAPLLQPRAARGEVEVAAGRGTLTGKEAREANKIIDDFLANSAKAFELDETREHLPSLERFFYQTGRFIELVNLYREVYDRKGPTHYIGPRLAWAYSSIGHGAEAMKILDEVEPKRPKDALIYMVRGSVLASSGTGTAADLTRIRDNWRKVVELDPNFEGPMGLDAEVLRVRLKEIDGALSKGSGGSPTKQSSK